MLVLLCFVPLFLAVFFLAIKAGPAFITWLRERQRETLEREAAEWLWHADQHSNQATEWRGMAQRYAEAGLKGPAFEARCWAETHQRKQAQATARYGETLAELADLQ